MLQRWSLVWKKPRLQRLSSRKNSVNNYSHSAMTWNTMG
jgi:hypothetical protein